jgi:hypothetical protein
MGKTSGCGRTKRYKGIREPRCAGGEGCWPCWAKYMLAHPNGTKFDIFINATAAEVESWPAWMKGKPDPKRRK